MQLEQIEISRSGARSSAAEYRRMSKKVSDPVLQDEYKQLARLYEQAVKDDVTLISLSATIREGGTMVRTVKNKWANTTHTYLLPKLAACVSDARYTYTDGVMADGSIEFVDRPSPRATLRSGRLAVDAGFDFPEAGYTAGNQLTDWSREAWAALVPIVPPKCAPPYNLRNYVTLWEVDDWQRHTLPAPPHDPALLKPIGGDLYAVLATWDLTPLEKLVLTGRPQRA